MDDDDNLVHALPAETESTDKDDSDEEEESSKIS